MLVAAEAGHRQVALAEQAELVVAEQVVLTLLEFLVYQTPVAVAVVTEVQQLLAATAVLES